MTVETIQAMLDACYQAKRIRDLMPDLPEGVMPSFIQYLDTIDTLERRGVRIRIFDISDALDLPPRRHADGQGYDGKGLS